MLPEKREMKALFESAQRAGDEQERWRFVRQLHRCGSSEVLSICQELARSPTAADRALAADVLGQLGSPRRIYQELCIATLERILEDETRENVLSSVIHALAHQERSDAIMRTARGFCNHPSNEVRFAVAVALTSCDSAEAMELLLFLSRDEDAEVREWATFGLSCMEDAECTAVHEVLLQCARDDDEDVRAEALLGLAKRGDTAAIPLLKAELEVGDLDRRLIEAAQLLGVAEFCSPLRNLSETWQADAEVEPYLLEMLHTAVRKCCRDSEEG